MTVKQTAGHDALGEFAPEFAHLNDDILFGEVWSREDKLPTPPRPTAASLAWASPTMPMRSTSSARATSRTSPAPTTTCPSTT